MTSRLDKARAAFAKVYDQDVWQLEQLEPPYDLERHIAAIIQDNIQKHKVRTVTEVGCGFWNYAKLVNWKGLTYNGYDVAYGPIEFNSNAYGARNIHFHHLVDGVQIAPADLLICKDVLQHLPNDDVLHYLAMFKELFSYMIIMNACSPEENLNGPIEHGSYRPLRLDLPPFNEKLEIIDEWDHPLFGVPYHEHVCLLRGHRRQPEPTETWANKILGKILP